MGTSPPQNKGDLKQGHLDMTKGQEEGLLKASCIFGCEDVLGFFGFGADMVLCQNLYRFARSKQGAAYLLASLPGLKQGHQ